MKLKITRSDRDGKKWKAEFIADNGAVKKTTHFGASGYEDYTQHKDKERRRLYRARHKNDNLTDKFSAGALSYYILWGDSTSIATNIRNFKSKFNLQ